MRAMRCRWPPSSWGLLKTFQQQLSREINLTRRRRDNERLRHIRLSQMDRITIFLLIILMLLVMALGAYVGHIFKGRLIEV
jgi:hypothetical protein